MPIKRNLLILTASFMLAGCSHTNALPFRVLPPPDVMQPPPEKSFVDRLDCLLDHYTNSPETPKEPVCS